MYVFTLGILAFVTVGAHGDRCQPSIKPPNIESGCCGVQEYSSKVLSSSTAEIDQYPWVALLEYNTTQYRTPCAGTLISSRYVLTAAHCLGNTIIGKPYQVRLAEYNTATGPIDTVEVIGGGTDSVELVNILIEKLILHPGYETRGQKNDIGLVKLAQDAPYNDFIRPICLPKEDITSTSASNLRVFSTGWKKDRDYTDIKQDFDLPYVPLDKCKESYSRLHKRVTLAETVICAGGDEAHPCRGQSGAPLMMELPWDRNNKYRAETHLVVGINSFGSANCVDARPDVYTSVYKYLDWINKETV